MNACKYSASIGSPWRSTKWFNRFFFPPVFINSHIAQVDRPKMKRMVFGSSVLCFEVFVSSLFFLFQIEDLENSTSFQSEIMKKHQILLHLLHTNMIGWNMTIKDWYMSAWKMWRHYYPRDYKHARFELFNSFSPNYLRYFWWQIWRAFSL